jgi:hypothetical protein
MGGFRKRGSGDLVESEDGYTVDLIGGRSFPAVTIRYVDGARRMDAFSEAQANRATLQLDRASMAGWEPPHATETVDDATRQTVLDRIMAAMSFAGYVIEPVGSFPTVRNQQEGKIELKRAVKRVLDEAKRRQRGH